MIEKLDINWGTFFEDCDDDVDLAWDNFMRKYNEVERECIPRKVVSTSKKRFSIPLDQKTASTQKEEIQIVEKIPDNKGC